MFHQWMINVWYSFLSLSESRRKFKEITPIQYTAYMYSTVYSIQPTRTVQYIVYSLHIQCSIQYTAYIYSTVYGIQPTYSVQYTVYSLHIEYRIKYTAYIYSQKHYFFCFRHATLLYILLYWHPQNLPITKFKWLAYWCTHMCVCILLTLIKLHCRRTKEFYWYSTATCAY
jgi:hypothetical protein